jgi:hypothetical protein
MMAIVTHAYVLALMEAFGPCSVVTETMTANEVFAEINEDYAGDAEAWAYTALAVEDIYVERSLQWVEDSERHARELAESNEFLRAMQDRIDAFFAN